MHTTELLAAVESGVGCCFCAIWIVGALLWIASLAFWVWMLVEVVTREPAEDKDKTLWIVVLVVTFVLGVGFIGALIYYFARRPERIRRYGR